jgi:hypothetical protein
MVNKKTKSKLVILVTTLGLVALSLWFYRIYIGDNIINLLRKDLPTPIKYDELKETNTSPITKDNIQAPLEVNLAVPFQPQAPHANWDQPYQDACEEAAAIMVSHYLNGTSLSADQMNKEILAIVEWENKFFGSSKDTNIAETTQLVNNYYPTLQAKAVYDITIEDIKNELEQGRAVVVLANGQLLGNPYYTQPGPEKHALVIKGFTDGKFIANDPGTKRGADFVYSTKKLYASIIDYDGNKAGTGKKAMIIISTKVGN